MKAGVRQVIGAAALTAIMLLGMTSSFAQDAPWHQRERRYQRAPAYERQRAVRPSPQQQAQPLPEPVPQNTQERAACLNKQTPPEMLIAACTVVIDAAQDRPGAALSSIYARRGDAYRDKNDHDRA